MTRRPGRPPIDPHGPSAPVTVRLPSQQYDRLYAIAREAQTTVPEIIRRLIRRPRADEGDADE